MRTSIRTLPFGGDGSQLIVTGPQAAHILTEVNRPHL
jgi:hypothetical protein